MRRLPLVFPLLALLVALASPAHAGVPAPAPISFVEDCLNVCPYGDIPFKVFVRDIASNPVVNSFVWIDVCQVPSVHVCFQGACTQLASGITDATGRVVLNPQGGGVTPPPFGQTARIYADGVLLATRVVGSPDQDGDLVVTAADLALGAAAVGTYNPTMDFDCNLASTGVITNADLALQQAHYGHSCTGPTPTSPRTWGGVKILYR